MIDYILVTATQSGRVLLLDAQKISTAILNETSQMSLNDCKIMHHGSIRPRGIKTYRNANPNIRAVRIAGSQDVCTLWVQKNSFDQLEMKESLGIKVGVENHDILRPGDTIEGEYVLSPGQGLLRSIAPQNAESIAAVKDITPEAIAVRRAARYTRELDKDGKPINLFDVEKAFRNTLTTPDTFTTLGRRNQDEPEPEPEIEETTEAKEPVKWTPIPVPVEDGKDSSGRDIKIPVRQALNPKEIAAVERDKTFDAVFIEKQSIPWPGSEGGWNGPHHVFSYKKNWWVCNSGARQIVNITQGKVYDLTGFPRGLCHGLNGTVMFCRTVHRDDDDNSQWASLLFVRVTESDFKIVTEITFEGYKELYQAAIL